MEAKELADIIAVVIAQTKRTSSLRCSIQLLGYFPQVPTISSSVSITGISIHLLQGLKWTRMAYLEKCPESRVQFLSLSFKESKFCLQYSQYFRLQRCIETTLSVIVGQSEDIYSKTNRLAAK